MKVSIDKEACIGCGLCASEQPDIFEMDADKAIVKSADVPAGKEDACKATAGNCPVSCIKCE
ncbi:MAG: ferredoxin [Elusimicrobiales bacterium]|jgi:ferredoxin|nr:ferredoxin [Elusimicrobiales bacterium]